MTRIRTRFAPSPTGMLHLGGIRTALYNYLLAKKYNGNFILRIEDTDRTRFVEGAEQYIIDSLKWLNIIPDEGVVNGGPHEPYRQSLRKDIYKKYAEILVKNGHAYYAFDTSEELDKMHKNLTLEGIANPQYDANSRSLMKNSLTLSSDEVQSRISNGEPYVIRFMTPNNEVIRFHDQVRGWIKVDSSVLDDKVLLKSDGMATYHLASIVDDYLMNISHVIRGEEWLPSAPLHILMYKAFGWEDVMPKFVHLPLLLKPEGQGKLSKRDAEEHGFPIFPLSWVDSQSGKTIVGFRELGYLPEAVVNFLALMGWNPGGDKELFSMDELVNDFSLERLGKSGARFNIKKAEWFNHQYIKSKSNDDLKPYIKTELVKLNITCDDSKIDKVCELVKERSNFVGDIWMHAKLFFVEPEEYEKDQFSSDAFDFIKKYISIVSDGKWIYEILHDTMNQMLIDHGYKLKDIMPTFRIILFGEHNGPDVIRSMIILGRDEVIKRVDNLILKL